MNTTANMDELFRIISADHHDPFNILGMHEIASKGGLVVRAFLPNAKEVKVHNISTKENVCYDMDKIHENGFFEVVLSDKNDFFEYELKITDYHENHYTIRDPYCFAPVLSDFDLYLFNEGNHHHVYEKLGSHICTIDGVKGTLFAVWAPSAKRVSVVGDFNQWDGRRHPMRSRGSSGVWELFIPNLDEGSFYKFEIKTPHGELYTKADPYAFYAELRPGTASRIYDIDAYTWNDYEWIKQRDNELCFDKPVSIYEVHLGSWKKTSDDDNGFYSYRELADNLVNYVADMGYTHIELMPVSEHPFDGSWGYQITGYYAATSRYGTPNDFKYFIDRCHQNGIGVIMDWVPAHFPKDAHGLARFDGTALYEHWHPQQGEHPDWGTHIFNYGRHEVKNFLVSNAIFWFEKYHIDGLRVDAVASMIYLDYGKKDGEWIPNKWGGKENVDAINFMRQLNSVIYNYFPGVMMIAEESTAWSMVTSPVQVGGLGFSYKWNMGWMNDYLRYISMDSVYRKYHHNLLTFSMIYAYSENFTLVLSHDEVVHGKCSMINKMPGDYWQKFAGLRTSYGYMYGHPGKKLLFMGGEFGQFNEWYYKKALEWNLLDYDMHRKLKDYVKVLNKLYREERALYEVDFNCNGFEWIDCNDSEHGIVSFLRKGNNSHDVLLFVCNFTPAVHHNYRIGAPYNTYYKEILNSDSEIFGGSGVGNNGGVQSEMVNFHNKPYSLNLTIPPLAISIFKPEL